MLSSHLVGLIFCWSRSWCRRRRRRWKSTGSRRASIRDKLSFENSMIKVFYSSMPGHSEQMHAHVIWLVRKSVLLCNTVPH